MAERKEYDGMDTIITRSVEAGRVLKPLGRLAKPLVENTKYMLGIAWSKQMRHFAEKRALRALKK